MKKLKRRLLPRTLFGRLFLILLVPMLLVQVVTVLVFYGRHWDTVTRYMSGNLAADIAVIADGFASDRNPDATAAFSMRYFHFIVEWQPGAEITQTPPPPNSAPYAERTFHAALDDRIDNPFGHDLHRDPDLMDIMIGYDDGVLLIKAGRKRIFSSTSWLVILWTIGTSILFLIIALLFTRGQVRPIRRLAGAARQLGLGRQVPHFKLEGAREVRLAGIAFQSMRQRILRQMVERTEMLAGVSHDLRTPLTRLKLQIAALPSSARGKSGDMEKDIEEMEAMITGYIDFANNAVVEEPKKSDLAAIIEESIASLGGRGNRIETDWPADLPRLPLRVRSIRRALDNIIGNALRHGRHCTIGIGYAKGDDQVQVIIDDDGPGIPKDKRMSVLRPFVRLGDEDTAANKKNAGLGLSIANDAVLAHGGLLLLGESPQGGLRVRIQLPL